MNFWPTRPYNRFNRLGENLDPDVSAFIAMWRITDPTEIDALNELAINLKGYGSTPNGSDVWSSCFAIYPISPTDINAAQGDLKNAFNMTMEGALTHTAAGVANSVNGYFNTGLILGINSPTEMGNTFSYSMSVFPPAVNFDMGSANNSSARRFLCVLTTGGLHQLSYLDNASTLSKSGLIDDVVTMQARVGTGKQVYSSGTSGTNLVATGTAPNISDFFMCRNNAGVASQFSPIDCVYNFHAKHLYLSANQLADLHFSISTYNTALSR